MKKFLLKTAAVLLLGGIFASPASAQFIGYTSPQTVQATLANNLACTGGSQTFVTGTTAGFNNLGQTQHVVSIIAGGGVTLLSAEIDGIDNNGNIFRISEQLRMPAFSTSSSLSGYGYYPRIQVLVTCSGGTFSATYAGSSSSQIPSIGSYQTAQINKIVFQNITAGSSRSDQIQTPFGSSAGTFVFIANNTIPAGTTIDVQCEGADISGTYLFRFTPSLTSGQNIYPVPAMSCPFVTVLYNSGGASGSTVTAQYYFNASGLLTGTYQINSQSLGALALTEPAAGTSALTNPIDTRGVKNATLSFNCTAGAYSVNVQEYSSDPVLATTKLVTPVTAITAGTQGELYIGSESNPSVDTGTLAVAPAGVVRFPQRALAFSFTNAGGAGTCTAQLYLTY